ncbi:hypothetical protein L208DRAFT_1405388 [Tricholoma matsutake]|nr:hypothetical protein L208DRAFT_1405388 [Tricholoma matsutake 945]
MALLATFWLRILHIFYSLILFVYSGCKRLTAASPQPLDAVRRRIPKHLAVVLVIDPNASSEDIEKSLTGTIVKLVGWCRVIGTQKLTVYEEHGRLIERVHRIREIFSNDCSEQDSSESEIDYPPTPPLSDCSESRPLLPQDIDGSFFSMNTESIHIAGKTCSCESSSALRSLCTC